MDCPVPRREEIPIRRCRRSSRSSEEFLQGKCMPSHIRRGSIAHMDNSTTLELTPHKILFHHLCLQDNRNKEYALNILLACRRRLNPECLDLHSHQVLSISNYHLEEENMYLSRSQLQVKARHRDMMILRRPPVQHPPTGRGHRRPVQHSSKASMWQS